MDPKYAVDSISETDLADLIREYQDVLPEKLKDLDKDRNITIPDLVSSRSSPAYMTKEELVRLVDWKLSHGTFRPKLRQLIQQNDDETVRRVTQQAFRIVEEADELWNEPLRQTEEYSRALKHVCQLKGVGPATGSLVLGCYKDGGGATLPFLDDELYRWLFWNEPPGKDGKTGWDRTIKYTEKEWLALTRRCVEIFTKWNDEKDENDETDENQNTRRSTRDLEHAAYVLAHGALSAPEQEAASKAAEVTVAKLGPSKPLPPKSLKPRRQLFTQAQMDVITMAGEGKKRKVDNVSGVEEEAEESPPPVKRITRSSAKLNGNGGGDVVTEEETQGCG